MRCLALIMSLFLLACNGPNTHEKNISNGQPIVKQINLSEHPKGFDSSQYSANGRNTKKQIKSIQKTSDALPTLTQDNMIPLLTEYGKNHPDNRVSISTQFGVIKIKLFKKINSSHFFFQNFLAQHTKNQIY